MNSYISGTGSALPSNVVANSAFEYLQFYNKDGSLFDKPSNLVVKKLESITGIRERRYISEDEDSVPLMVEAAQAALNDAGLEGNDLDGIIVAHNAGNMVPGISSYHPVPNLAAHLKHGLGIGSHEMFAYDILFGCPGWLQAFIQAHQAIRNGDAKHVLIVGLEVASRMLDPHDVDSMIFADGCGATIISTTESDMGVKAYHTFSHAQADLMNIYLSGSNNPGCPGDTYVKMNGREVYKYATTYLPQVIKKSLDKCNKSIADVDLFLFHQANEKMLEAIANRVAEEFDRKDLDFSDKIPLTIHTLGNTSVATIPTMMDFIRKGKMEDYNIKKGDLVVFASVGAGMHCNAMVYQF
ncbi:MAG: ketoacyl-ACP synthase III [Saprospiraceae bacterium]|nr:ketoacyl-ACP synthase III [Saprospiraceae bacterium]